MEAETPEEGINIKQLIDDSTTQKGSDCQLHPYRHDFRGGYIFDAT